MIFNDKKMLELITPLLFQLGNCSNFDYVVSFFFCKQLWTEQLTNSTEGFVEVLVSTDLARLTLDVIGRCAFGYHFNTVLSGETEISSAFSAVIKGVGFG